MNLSVGAVPDDWCAPLGTEHVPKQEEAFCPSVRLREFSIPLFHVPIVKKEVCIKEKNMLKCLSLKL